ncbi:MAG: hypothetical protein COA70_13765 [Planctomycetota bacterium]|nr:MAG: hypothetical protein COA70_13765 [Planctomycetota bacterium]
MFLLVGCTAPKAEQDLQETLTVVDLAAEGPEEMGDVDTTSFCEDCWAIDWSFRPKTFVPKPPPFPAH